MSDINDQIQLQQLIDGTQESVTYYEEVEKDIVSKYTDYLDDIMSQVYTNIVAIDNPSLNVLEKYFMELSNAIYFCSDRAEKVGIYDDVSKSQMKETYNKAYLDSQNPVNGKMTVAASTALAESASAMNTILNSIYNRSYKIIKNKIDSAQEMVKVISKLISRRMVEMQMTQQTFPNAIEQSNNEEETVY